MVNETGKKNPTSPHINSGVKRRGLLRFGTLVSAFTGASAVSALVANSAEASPGDKTPPNTYVPVAEKGSPSGVAALDLDAKIILAQLPDLSDTYATKDIEISKLDKTEAATTYRAKSDAALNILDYGVVRGRTTSQTAAIKAALDANPGKEFYFPPGNYRLDTGLVISMANSLVLAEGARLYAGAPMSTMITYLLTDPGYAEDKALVGGLLDGFLNAQRILSISKVIRFTLEKTTFKDGLKRGLVTEAGLGAELIASNLRFYNSGTTNVADNIAIEAKMGDSHFRDIIIRDWTTAVKDIAANRWDRVHPWISQDTTGNPQMTSRYPASIAFDLTGSSDIQACVSDTHRIGYKLRSNGTSYTAPPRLLNARAMWASDPILPTALAAANPAFVLDNSDGVGAICDRLTAAGHTMAAAAFLIGPPTNLTTRNTFSYGYIKGHTGATSDPLDYNRGVLNGTLTFTPTIVGSINAGTHAYHARSGRMVVKGDEVSYYVRIHATLDATSAFSGAFRVGGIPLPVGATSLRDGAGMVGYCTNIQAETAVIFANASPYLSVYAPPTATGTPEVDILGQSLRGKTVDLMLSVTVTHLKS